MTGLIEINATATDSNTTSEEIQIPPGYTLVGISFPTEATSTTFTITHSAVTGGTFLTLRDPLGTYSGSAGSAITFTIGSTSLGIYPILPVLSVLLYSRIKIILGSSETKGVVLIFKNFS